MEVERASEHRGIAVGSGGSKDGVGSHLSRWVSSMVVGNAPILMSFDCATLVDSGKRAKTLGPITQSGVQSGMGEDGKEQFLRLLLGPIASGASA